MKVYEIVIPKYRVKAIGDEPSEDGTFVNITLKNGKHIFVKYEWTIVLDCNGDVVLQYVDEGNEKT